MRPLCPLRGNHVPRRTLFAPRLKSPLKQDDLYSYASNRNDSDTTILRKIEGWTSVYEKSAKIFADCSWQVPEEMEVGFSLLNDVGLGVATYKLTNHFERVLNDGSYEFIREEVLITDYVLVRSTIPAEVNGINADHPAVLAALNEQRDIKGGELGLGKHA